LFVTANLLKLAREVALGMTVALLVVAPAKAQTDPLPSWNDTAPKAAIIAFVDKVTKQGSPDFVPEPERIAVFDNDGTLWVEHPMYTQLAFALDRVKAEAANHPEWKESQPFKAVLDGDMKTLAEAGEKGLVELIMATHAGMTTAEFQKIVSDWIATARDPRFKRPYTELVYQPMLELLAYLRANGFKTYIASGGGIEFMRPFTERVYGVPPEQVVGSSIKTRFEMKDGSPTLFRLPEVNFIDDKTGKPVGINEHIGRRPIAAFGNSDGDLEMLQWTTLSGKPGFGLIVHHTDADREYDYDRKTPFGKLDTALDAAAINQWTVVDMKTDWKVIFPFELK
jgi:phosphoserine phosphatase